jgi:uncharacterized protein YdhG (YjbR/CyaY superfamily)
MQSKATTVKDYISELPEDRKEVITKLRNIIRKNLPEGFQEVISYGMIGYVVPHKLYPKGYHADPALPLPFINLASQKNYIALYHMSISGDKKLLEWFTKEWKGAEVGKLDMGKSCIRFKKPEHIPFELIGKLAGKISVDTWIKTYEKNRE